MGYRLWNWHLASYAFKKQGRRQKAEGRRKEDLACLFHSSRVAIAASWGAFKKHYKLVIPPQTSRAPQNKPKLAIATQLYQCRRS